MRRFVWAAGALCAMAVMSGWFSTGSVMADERSPFRLLDTASSATTDGTPRESRVTAVGWGHGYGGYYRPYSSYYRPYGGYYRPYGSYYRPYSSYYRPYGGYYGGYGYRPYGSYYRPYYGGYGGYYGYRPGISLYFGF